MFFSFSLSFLLNLNAKTAYLPMSTVNCVRMFGLFFCSCCCCTFSCALQLALDLDLILKSYSVHSCNCCWYIELSMDDSMKGQGHTPRPLKKMHWNSFCTGVYIRWNGRPNDFLAESKPSSICSFVCSALQLEFLRKSGQKYAAIVASCYHSAAHWANKHTSMDIPYILSDYL